MARTGSFPLSVPWSLLTAFCSSGSIILDPFCGKGTTLLAARLLGHRAYGLDVSPEAVICSKAKLLSTSIEEVEDFISTIPTTCTRIEDVPSRVSVFFHPDTLGQLLTVRGFLLSSMRSPDASVARCATFVTAVALGILHGHATYSLSIASSHAFSMSPGYVSRFAARHSLPLPVRDVRACLLTKAALCLKQATPRPRGQVKLGSAFDMTRLFPSLQSRVDAIITSPPYMNRQTYAKDNWLRLWFLETDTKTIRAQSLETASASRYLQSMRLLVQQASRMLKHKGALICVVGDVRSSGKAREIINTADLLVAAVREAAPMLTVESCTRQDFKPTSRYFNALAKSNGHTNVALPERVIVIRKGSGK